MTLMSTSEEIEPLYRHGFHILPCFSISPVLKVNIDTQIEECIQKKKKQEKQRKKKEAMANMQMHLVQ